MAGEDELQTGNLDPIDLIPPDDRAEPVAEARERQADIAPEPAKEERLKEGSPYQAKRDSIVEKIRAQRDALDKSPSIDIPPEMERQAVGKHVATREDRTRPPAEEVAQALSTEEAKPVRRITLKINGEDREFDEEQVKNYAQISVAAQDVLNQAKRDRDAAQEERRLASEELAELRRLRADHSSKPAEQPTPAQAPAEDTKPATDEELDSLIEAIQTGEIQDAKKALQTYGDQIERRMMEKIGNIDDRIAATTQRMQEDARVRAETQTTIDDFLRDNSDFNSRPMMAEALINQTVMVMRENLAALNVKDETIDNIARTFKVAPQVAVGLATRRLREQGYEIPDGATVMRTAAKRVRDGLGMSDPAARPTPAPGVDPTSSIMAERAERRQAMPTQPRRANVAPGAETATEKSQEQRRKDAVMQMRASRRGR